MDKQNQSVKLPGIKTFLPSEIIYYGLTEEQIDILAKGRIGSNIYLTLATFFFTIGFSSFIVLSTMKLLWYIWLVYIVILIASGSMCVIFIVQWIIKIKSISRMVKEIKQRTKPKAIKEDKRVLSTENSSRTNNVQTK